ncbi:type II toxin-antitoxin system MqsA family antitoxin [Halopseudomonas nanhaiensis]|uniref:type II toxin-antitoxin system MqsA family antitoxin n=1 Tax=Halopseudomonas nanhaiensis TaxID=2830842 RepID=UPI001CBF4AF6|nr:type II toxin-antitoxin system MqsA family antitoxin [Halopseudomonas nanhaiensis]
MKCPTCGAAELIPDVRDLPFTLNEQTTVIYNVEGEYCPSCGDVLIAAVDSTRVSEQLLAFKDDVDR